MKGEGTCIKITVTKQLERKKLNILNRFSMNKEDYKFEKVTFTESCQCEIIKGGLFEQLLR